MINFLSFLKSTMNKPTLYGWFHLLCFALTIGVAVLLSIKLKNADDKKIRKFLLISSIIMICLEIYKQFIFSYSISDGVITWNYQWYAFPFQFCSTPMYIALIASLVKKGKFQDCLYSFLATFGLFGGLIVMLVPSNVFMSYIGINIQTMVHHGLMIVIGAVLLSSKSVKLEHKTILKAGYVFLALSAIALLMNCVYVWCGGTHNFNMFYISPYKESELLVFKDIQKAVPFVIFLLSYIVGFSLAGYIVLLVAMLINHIISKNKRQNIKS